MPLNNHLQILIQRDQIAKTLLFCGYDKAILEEQSKAFALEVLGKKVLSGNHPDLHLYKPEGKIGLHSIASIRSLIDEVYLPPNESKYKIFIIEDAQRMLPTSANALLKTLEEPLHDTILILQAPSTQEILPTIVSRCQSFLFPSQKNYEPHEKVVKLLASTSSYLELIDQVKEMGADLEQMAKKIEKDALKEFGNEQHKEVEALVSMQIAKIEEQALTSLFAWFRDLHLIAVKGDVTYLLHKEYEEILQERAKRKIPSLALVQKHITCAKLALQRSASFSTTFESLLLKLL